MTPDTNQATEAQTSNISQLSSGIKQYARQTTLSIMTALSTLVPSGSTTMTAVGAGAIAATTMSCEKDGGVDPVADVDPINRKTDNPAHLADFMKDVKSKIIGN
jgi:ornithine cyclodeaminase/alanine dehydrogenase-like protein (mu-crystallin family)